MTECDPGPGPLDVNRSRGQLLLRVKPLNLESVSSTNRSKKPVETHPISYCYSWSRTVSCFWSVRSRSVCPRWCLGSELSVNFVNSLYNVSLTEHP